jgi:hypothetical protein
LRRTPLRSSAKPVFQPLVAHYPNIVQLIALFDKKIPQFSIWVANRLTELMGWGTVTAAAFLCGRLNARFVGMIVAAVALASVAIVILRSPDHQRIRLVRTCGSSSKNSGSLLEKLST